MRGTSARVLAAAMLTAWLPCQGTWEPDHLVPRWPEVVLEPVDPLLGYVDLARRCFDTAGAAPFAMTVLPSFAHEYAVVLEPVGGRRFRRHTRTRTNLWCESCADRDGSRSAVMSPAALARGVVASWSVPFDGALAARVAAAGHRMLSRTRPAEPLLGCDGTNFEFIAGDRRGWTWSPRTRAGPRLLVDLGESLVGYVQAEVLGSGAARGRIEACLGKLERWLDATQADHDRATMTAMPLLPALAAQALLPALDLAAEDRGGVPPPVEIVIRARIDGSDRLVIDREGWRWTCTAWGPPQEPVWVEGHAWDVRREGFVPHERWRLLPPDADFERAALTIEEGRDVAGLERHPDRVVLRFADTPNGPASYSVRLRLPCGSAEASIPAPLAPRVTLVVRARIDGSDSFVFGRRGVSWWHRWWGAPSDVSLNGVPWPVERSPILRYSEGRAFLPADVDLRSAVARVVRGRDTVVVDASTGLLFVHFADNDPGADDYEVAISFHVPLPRSAPPPATLAAGPSEPPAGSIPAPTGPAPDAGSRTRAPVPASPVPTLRPSPPLDPRTGRRPIAPPETLPAEPTRLSAATGEAGARAPLRWVQLCVDGGVARAGQHYAILCSLADPGDGFALPGFGSIPLQPDALTFAMLAASPTLLPWIADWSGALDAQGRASPWLRLDATVRAALAGRRLTCVALVWPTAAGPAVGTVSNPVVVRLR